MPTGLELIIKTSNCTKLDTLLKKVGNYKNVKLKSPLSSPDLAAVMHAIRRLNVNAPALQIRGHFKGNGFNF